MTVTNKPTWNDGQLRSVQLITNGFPDDDEPALPDELFLSDVEGNRIVEIIRSGGQWEARDNPMGAYVYEDFQDAFEKGLQLARMEIEQ